MTTKPATRIKATAQSKARTAWGETIPDWILALAAEADLTSAKRASTRIGYSAATVSFVLSATYPGHLGAVEQAVRGALMAHTVACPLVGDLAADKCLINQRAPWSPHNPQRIAFFRACRGGCPHYRQGDSHG